MNNITDEIKVKVHEVKTWPKFFQLVKYGFKGFELRKNDRDYKQGDYLCQREWDPKTEVYTGDRVTHRIGFVLEGFGLKDGYVAMQLEEDRLTELHTITKK